MSTGKLTFQRARMQAQSVTSRQVADRAGVPLHEEYLMELGSPVTRQFAEKVLMAFSHLAGNTWTLGDLDIPLNDVLGAEQASTELRHCNTK